MHRLAISSAGVAPPKSSETLETGEDVVSIDDVDDGLGVKVAFCRTWTIVAKREVRLRDGQLLPRPTLLAVNQQDDRMRLRIHTLLCDSLSYTE